MRRLMPGVLLCPLLCLLPAAVSAAVKVRQPAPPLSGTVMGGGAISLKQLRGKVVVVDFWATWCEPCKASLPRYEALQRKYADRGLVILAVSVDEDAANVRRFARKHGLSLRVIHDKGGKIAERFQPPKMPTAYLIGRDGRVRWVHAGFRTGDGAKVSAQVLAALGPANKPRPPKRAQPRTPGHASPEAPVPPAPKSPAPKSPAPKSPAPANPAPESPAPTNPAPANPAPKSHSPRRPGGPAPAAAPSRAPVVQRGSKAVWRQRTRGIMGTRFVILARVQGETQSAALDRALDHVAVLERRWSPWIDTSDLARLNAAPAGRAVRVTPSTARLLRRATALCVASSGAFDPTFFSLHGLWQLKARPFAPPTDAAIAARLADVGCRQVRVTGSTAERRRAGTQLHLGGNAKGTALDEAAALLLRAGIQHFVVDGGGDLVTHGLGPKGPWRVGIKRPRGARRQVAARLALSKGEAVATSGDYERFIIYKGKRYHHILDPRTGWPVQGTRQVTVVVRRGPRAGERADGLATALFVLGPEAGLALIARNLGVDALIIDAKGHWHVSPGMRVRLGARATSH